MPNPTPDPRRALPGITRGADACAMPDAMAAVPDDHLFERARGIDLADLDGLAKDRWRDGYDAGHGEGGAKARAEFPAVYEDGHRAGHVAGWDDLGQRFSARVHLAHQLALNVAQAHGRGEEADAAEALGVIGEVLESIISEHNRGPEGERGQPRRSDDTSPLAERIRRLPEDAPEARAAVRARLLEQLRAWLPE